MQCVLDILELAQGGEGVGRVEARAVFVPYTAPGDQVAAEVPGGTGPAHASLVEVLRPGKERVEAPCRHFGPGARAGCGGCEWLHVAYEAQLAAKQHAFTETLRRIGGLGPGTYRDRGILPSPSPLRYRARATATSVSVGLIEVAESDPLGTLQGTDNQFSFTTERYRAQPLVIRGPGAGPAVTAAGVFNDLLRLASERGSEPRSRSRVHARSTAREKETATA